MVDEALAETGAAQQRMRKLPARAVVCLLLAAAVFEECGYLVVWHKLTAALETLPIPKITGAAPWDARTRLGVRPMRCRSGSAPGCRSTRRSTRRTRR